MFRNFLNYYLFALEIVNKRRESKIMNLPDGMHINILVLENKILPKNNTYCYWLFSNRALIKNNDTIMFSTDCMDLKIEDFTYY
jgi:hypothetical protein